ncbi:uncharacterized protein LOC127808519 [Diospyros lotus]|uniref:uncharacterized protein LOC127808519 n=1 Tax=Diospyros lotus TaxID=55363 RepID=UPI0022532E5B|nr:uncharacterized protein LOC127808519 [Diospyros lotus]
MITSTVASSTKMSWRRTKSPGWAAFDLNQHKKGLELEDDDEPYPLLSNAITSSPSQNFVQNNNLPLGPFSSVLLPTQKFPSLTDVNGKKPLEVGKSSATATYKFTNDEYTKLEELHCWADKSLIQDIMEAVDNDVHRASALLMAMVSPKSLEHNEESNIRESISNSEQLWRNPKKLQVDKCDSSGEHTNIADARCVIEYSLNYMNELTTSQASCGNQNSSDGMDIQLTLGHMTSIPIEPEWEEDDAYSIHRKEAIRMMRSAAQHSRAAADAYLRGDHFTAKEYSTKGKEEWLAAERLNAKAAKEIFRIRNSNKGLWEMDLHGLHSREAVQALQERLQKIESLLPLDQSASPHINSKGTTMVRSWKSLSSTEPEVEKLHESRASSWQKSTSLNVITGRGNHSHGEAVLPTAIRNFLSENGYRFDETRPGLITVRPKFHSLERLTNYR